MDWQYWCIVLALLTTVGSFECPEGAGCSICQYFSDGVQEIDCTIDNKEAIRVQLRPNDYVQIMCHNPVNWTEFHLSSSHPIEGVTKLNFNKCNLPQVNGLGSIAKQLLLNDIEILSFISYSEVNLNLTREHLRGFTNVKELTLSSNNFSNLADDLLQDLPNLSLLNLRGNDLQNLPKQFFRAPKLKVIELGDNKLETLDSSPFDSVERVQLLNIWKNTLVKIFPNTFDKLVSLETLGLQRNKLETLPHDIFARLKNLRILNLSSNDFTSDTLPADLLKNNENLESFTLIENKKNITTLPNGFFANLTKLVTIKLNGNRLRTLPEDLFWGTTNLTNLGIPRNFLTTLPSKIFKDTKNLSTLDLSVNHLSSLPDDVFSSLRKLVKLDLWGNNITTISRKLFFGLSSLRELNMARNNMIRVDYHAFDQLRMLRVAKFSYNQLTLAGSTSIEIQSPFRACKDLEELHLDHNNISLIFDDWIYWGKLRILDLSYNKLQMLKNQDLQFFSQDLVVDFTHNNISYIDLRHVEDWAAHRSIARNVKISIENNPIRCDCKLYDLLRYLEGRLHPNVQNAFHLQVGQMQCDAPNGSQKIFITELKSKTFKCDATGPEFKGMNCPKKCTCSQILDNNTYVVNCANQNLTEAPREIGSPHNRTVELNLSGNLLRVMPSFYQPGYDKVTILALDHNNISKISSDSLWSGLKVLKLHDNQLKRVDKAVLEFLSNATYLSELTLESNPWICDCDAREFLNFIQKKSIDIPDLLKVACSEKQVPLYQMTPEELCPSSIGLIIGGSLGIALLGIIVGCLAALYYRYQREIKVWLYSRNACLWFVTENELDREKLYDAFISYSHKDEDFVVNDLMPNLEADPRQFKLCVHFRDWLAGEWIPKQIARSVEESRRTIVVLSPNFLESIWGRMEFRAAHSQALSEGRARVIVILYGEIGPTEDLDPELKAYLSMNTYVKWGDPWFWQKLKYAMPHPPEFAKRKLRPSIFETTKPRINVTSDKNELISSPRIPTSPHITTTPPADSLKIFVINAGDVANNEHEKSSINETKKMNDNTTPIVITNCNNKKISAIINKVQCTTV